MELKKDPNLGDWWDPKILQLYSAHFFFMAEIVDWSIQCWILFIGTSLEARKYSYTMTVQSKETNEKLEYSGKVYSVDENHICCPQSGNESLFVISKKLANKLSRKESELNVRVTINQISWDEIRENIDENAF